MSDNYYSDVEEREIRQEITSLKNLNVTALEMQSAALQMINDGFTSSQIAEALDVDVKIIDNLTQAKVELGSPEEVIQESLRTILSLIPIAEAQYRQKPAATYAYTLTGFIESARSLIQQADALKDKENVYRSILAKVLQPFCREMIKSMLAEVAILHNNNQINSEELKLFSTNLGKKFQESYRKASEELATILGVSAEVRERIAGTNSATE